MYYFIKIFYQSRKKKEQPQGLPYYNKKRRNMNKAQEIITISIIDLLHPS
jgi:phosphopantetheinyl transferase